MTKCKFANCCPCYADYIKAHCSNTENGEPDSYCAGRILGEYLHLETLLHQQKSKVFDDAMDWLRDTYDESSAD